MKCIDHVPGTGNAAQATIIFSASIEPNDRGGEHLAMVGDFLSFNEIIDTLNQLGNTLSFKQVPREVFASWFPHADVAPLGMPP